MASVRRLTAILAADVAGYSRLMGADEEGTHERLKAFAVRMDHGTDEEVLGAALWSHRGSAVGGNARTIAPQGSFSTESEPEWSRTKAQEETR